MMFLAFLLIFIGLMLVITEMFVTIGIFGLTGLITFAIGAVLLWRMGLYVYEFFWPLVIGEAILIVIFLAIAGVLFVKSRSRPIVSGREELAGSIGKIIHVEPEQALMRLRGEVWQVKSNAPLTVGQKVIVTDREGMVLIVSLKP